jgi:hypothetical protein
VGKWGIGVVALLITMLGLTGLQVARSSDQAAGAIPPYFLSPSTVLRQPTPSGATASPSPLASAAAATPTPVTLLPPTPSPLATAQVSPPPPAPIVFQPFLQISGRAFSYRGGTVYLRGVNINNESALYLEQPTYSDANYSEAAGFAYAASAMPTNITEDDRDYARLASWHVNVVRLGLDWHWFNGDAATTARAWAYVDRTVASARRYHIWLVPVMFIPRGGGMDYQYDTRFWGGQSGFNPGALTVYMVSLRDFWKSFAARYRNEPAIAGYDLLNEPSTPYINQVWLPYASYLRDQIKQVDPNHFFVIESGPNAQFSERLPLGSSSKYPDIVYSVHGYAPTSMTHATTSTYSYPGNAPDWDGTIRYWSASTLQTMMQVQGRLPINWAATQSVPLFMGEWGSRKRTAGYVTYVADNINLMLNWQMSWAYFNYREFDPTRDFGLYNASSGMSFGAVADSGLINVVSSGVRNNVMAN